MILKALEMQGFKSAAGMQPHSDDLYARILKHWYEL